MDKRVYAVRVQIGTTYVEEGEHGWNAKEQDFRYFTTMCKIGGKRIDLTTLHRAIEKATLPILHPEIGLKEYRKHYQQSEDSLWSLAYELGRF